MNPHPPLVERELAVVPERVRFTWEELVVRCPACHAVERYVLSGARPPVDSFCPHCRVPWRWN